MKKRLFIAIPLGDEWFGAFGEFQRKCEKETDKLSDLRWMKVENLHITICFLGWIAEEKTPDISQKLKEVLGSVKPFDLEFENIIFGPLKTTARMIWAIFKGNENYKRLSKSINEAMQIEENREPIAHITLARFTNGHISKNKGILELFSTKDKFLKVDNIQLMESKLSQAGPTYSIIENFILK